MPVISKIAQKVLSRARPRLSGRVRDIFLTLCSSGERKSLGWGAGEPFLKGGSCWGAFANAFSPVAAKGSRGGSPRKLANKIA